MEVVGVRGESEDMTLGGIKRPDASVSLVKLTTPLSLLGIALGQHYRRLLILIARSGQKWRRQEKGLSTSSIRGRGSMRTALFSNIGSQSELYLIVRPR